MNELTRRTAIAQAATHAARSGALPARTAEVARRIDRWSAANTKGGLETQQNNSRREGGNKHIRCGCHVIRGWAQHSPCARRFGCSGRCSATCPCACAGQRQRQRWCIDRRQWQVGQRQRGGCEIGQRQWRQIGQRRKWRQRCSCGWVDGRNYKHKKRRGESKSAV